MKKLFTLIAGAIFAGTVAFAQPIPISSWNFNQSTSPSYVDLNVTASPVTLYGVNNIALASTCDQFGYHGKDWTESSAIDLSQYYEFTITPATNYSIDLAEISFGYNRSQHGPKNGEIRSSIDNFSSAIQTFSYQNNASGSCYIENIGLGASTAFLGVSAPVTFRIYGYKAGNNTNSRVLIIDDVVIKGVVIPGIALPVKITAITAAFTNNNVEVKWTTAVEKNNDHFIVEKSDDGKEFTAIGYIKGAGTSDVNNHYTFIDSELNGDKLFYRLKQVDLDGQFSYSSILPVHIKKGHFETKAIAISGTNKVIVQHSALSDGSIEVSVVDINGKVLSLYNLPVNKGNNAYELTTGNLPAGIYILSVKTEQGITARKFIK